MKSLLTAVVAVGMLAAPTLAFAQQYNNQGWEIPAPDSANSPMHGSHDKGAIVRELDSNGLYGQMHRDRSAYEDYYNPRH